MNKIFLLRRMFFCPAVLIMLMLAASCTAGNEEVILRYGRAKELYSRGQFTEAVSLLAQDNKFVPALVLRAKAEYFTGDLVKAETSLRKAIKKRSSLFEAKLYLARIVRESGDIEQADKIVAELLADNPQDIRTLRFASELARERGRMDEAQSLLDLAAESSAESAMVLLDRARLHYIAGRTHDALEDLDRAGAVLPWDTPLRVSIKSLESIIKETLQ